MSSSTVHTSARISSIDRSLRSIPEKLLGGGNATRAILLRAGLALKRRIHQAFIIKARGGTDEANERWVLLSPTTIAYRRAKRTSTEKKRSDHPSQVLTAKQRERWWELYYQGGGDSPSRRAAAAKRAWAILKSEGATTLFQKYKDTSVEILRDTGLLLNSLSPEIKSSKHAVLRVERNVVAVGTNRKGASAHHHGNPRKKLPQRRLWPAPANWPAPWWRDIIEQVQQGIIDLVIQSIRGS